MKQSLTLFAVFASLALDSQSAQQMRQPVIQWQQSVGGSGYEYLFRMVETPDGSVVFGGLSYSDTSGNKTSPSYDTNRFDPFNSGDWWAVKLGPERPLGADNDRIADDHDHCPDTPQGTIVNAHGCSIEQPAPCEGGWENHGQYVRAIVQATARFREAGLIAASEQQSILERAAKSDCRKPTPGKGRSF